MFMEFKLNMPLILFIYSRLNLLRCYLFYFLVNIFDKVFFAEVCTQAAFFTKNCTGLAFEKRLS